MCADADTTAFEKAIRVFAFVAMLGGVIRKG